MLRIAPTKLYAKVITLPNSNDTINTLIIETTTVSTTPNLYNNKTITMFGSPIFIPGATVESGGNKVSK